MGLLSTRAKSVNHVRKHIDVYPLTPQVIFGVEFDPAAYRTHPDLQGTQFTHFTLRGIFGPTKSIKNMKDRPDAKVPAEKLGLVYGDDAETRDEYPLAAVVVPKVNLNSTDLKRPVEPQVQIVAMTGVSYECLELNDDLFSLEAAARGLHVVANGLYIEEFDKVRRLIEPREGLKS
jgi:hypothetical protein